MSKKAFGITVVVLFIIVCVLRAGLTTEQTVTVGSGANAHTWTYVTD